MATHIASMFMIVCTRGSSLSPRNSIPMLEVNSGIGLLVALILAPHSLTLWGVLLERTVPQISSKRMS